MTAREGEATDHNGLKDGLVVHLNGEVVQGVFTLPKIPDRPKDISEKKSVWEEYAVSLGLSPELAAEWVKEDIVKWCG
jgi:hypothetical protein